MVSAVLQQESVTVRIAFDGAPLAGKTTAAYSLSEALGETACTPEADTNGRTLWFDWMTYTAGRHEGRSIRTELVTVPGQNELGGRRDHLLNWADVIVFVVDTRTGAFGDSVERFLALRADVLQDGADGDKPFVVVANKRDMPDAIDLEEVRTGLELSNDDVLIEAVATTGSGVRQAFIFAVRAALAASDELRFDMSDPDVLLEQLQAAEQRGEPGEAAVMPQEPTDDLLRRALAIEHDLREVLASSVEADNGRGRHRPEVEELVEWIDSTVSSSDDYSRDADQAAALAATILAEAERRAEQHIADATTAAERIRQEAAEKASEVVEAEREAYRNRTATIVDDAIAQAEQLVAEARERARGAEETVHGTRARVLAELESELAERENDTSRRNDELHTQAVALIERAIAESEDIRQLALVEADTLIADAQAARAEVLQQVEEMRNSAQHRLAEEMAAAAHRGAGDARVEVEERLAELRATIERIQPDHELALTEAGSAARRTRYEAFEQGARIIGQALTSADAAPDIRSYIDSRLRNWSTADA